MTYEGGYLQQVFSEWHADLDLHVTRVYIICESTFKNDIT